MKKIYEITLTDNKKINILCQDYGTHVSIKDIGLNNDINYMFGSTILVTNRPSTIEDELQYYIKNHFTYLKVKVKQYKLIKSK